VFDVFDGNDFCPATKRSGNNIRRNCSKNKFEQVRLLFCLISNEIRGIICLVEVELLVMRALSLKLVKGVIDEVSERVHMTWVQPRVLNTEQVTHWALSNCIKLYIQIGRMRDRLSCWVKEVAETETLIEENARPILTC